ncbi:MFS transporter [Staphylococcus saprophyticus]
MLSNQLKIRLLLLFVQKLATSSIIPFIALYLTDLSNTKVSSIILMISLCLNIFFSFIGGRISDRYNKKKIVVITSLSIFFTYLLLFFTLINHYNHITLIVILYCLSESILGILSSSQNSLTLENLTDNQRKPFSRYQYWIGNVALSIGLLLGGSLYGEYTPILFLSLSLAYIIISATTLFFIRSNETISKSKTSETSKTYYSEILRDWRYLLLILSLSLVIFAEYLLSSYVVVRLEKSFSPINFWGIYITGVNVFTIIMIINTLTVVIFSLPISKLVSSFSVNKALILGGILYTLGYSIVIGSNTFTILIIFIFIASIGEIIYSPIVNSEKVKLIPKSKRGTYSAIDGLVYQFGNLLSRLCLAFAFIFSPYFFSVLACVIMLIGFIIIFVIINITRKINFLT